MKGVDAAIAKYPFIDGPVLAAAAVLTGYMSTDLPRTRVVKCSFSHADPGIIQHVRRHRGGVVP